MPGGRRLASAWSWPRRWDICPSPSPVRGHAGCPTPRSLRARNGQVPAPKYWPVRAWPARFLKSELWAWSARPLPGHWVASGKPVVGLIENVLSLPLACHWLTALGPSGARCPTFPARARRSKTLSRHDLREMTSSNHRKRNLGPMDNTSHYYGGTSPALVASKLGHRIRFTLRENREANYIAHCDGDILPCAGSAILDGTWGPTGTLSIDAT
jgi:hypothetical protein